MQSLTLEQMDALFLEADEDGSGEIEVDEFEVLLKRYLLNLSQCQPCSPVLHFVVVD